jgi:hypothetical protein
MAAISLRRSSSRMRGRAGRRVSILSSTQWKSRAASSRIFRPMRLRSRPWSVRARAPPAHCRKSSRPISCSHFNRGSWQHPGLALRECTGAGHRDNASRRGRGRSARRMAAVLGQRCELYLGAGPGVRRDGPVKASVIVLTLAAAIIAPALSALSRITRCSMVNSSAAKRSGWLRLMICGAF